MRSYASVVRLFHFSDDPTLTRFVPRPVTVPSPRPAGRDWLNGPLVWAIDDGHAPMYLFPRDCPRILVWPTPTTTQADLDRHWQSRTCRILAHIETAWLERLHTARLYRYELPVGAFLDLADAGMHVSRETVEPIGMDELGDLPAALCAAGVELRVMSDLRPLANLWETSLHVSGIRLRNAQHGPLHWRLTANPQA